MTATRVWPAPATTRPVLGLPFGGTTLHLIGDVHAGAIQSWRLDTVAADVRRLVTPVAHIQLGDNADDGSDAMDDIFAEFMGRLPAPWYNVQGNHDLISKTSAQWAARWGHPSPGYVVDFAAFRLIVLGCDTVVPGVPATFYQLSPSNLTFLDISLSGTTKPCFIACHYPLWDTCGGDVAVEYTSFYGGWSVASTAHTTDSSDILAVLAAHSNVKAWISGHTHSRVTVPGLVMPMTAGSVRFASINTSCIWYCGNDHNSNAGGPPDPVNSLYATWFDSGRMEVRFRGHGAGQWIAPNGSPVMTVTGLS